MRAVCTLYHPAISPAPRKPLEKGHPHSLPSYSSVMQTNPSQTKGLCEHLTLLGSSPWGYGSQLVYLFHSDEGYHGCKTGAIEQNVKVLCTCVVKTCMYTCMCGYTCLYRLEVELEYLSLFCSPFFYFCKNIILCICMMCVLECACHSTSVAFMEVRGQPCGAGSLFPRLCGFWGLNSSCQVISLRASVYPLIHLTGSSILFSETGSLIEP